MLVLNGFKPHFSTALSLKQSYGTCAHVKVKPLGTNFLYDISSSTGMYLLSCEGQMFVTLREYS